MPARTISSELLNITVGIKREAGVSSAQVRDLIEAFIDNDGRQSDSDGMVGFLWVDDIPAHRREEFLSALSSLAPSTDPAERETPRLISANEIWSSRIAE